MFSWPDVGSGYILARKPETFPTFLQVNTVEWLIFTWSKKRTSLLTSYVQVWSAITQWTTGLVSGGLGILLSKQGFKSHHSRWNIWNASIIKADHEASLNYKCPDSGISLEKFSDLVHSVLYLYTTVIDAGIIRSKLLSSAEWRAAGDGQWMIGNNANVTI